MNDQLDKNNKLLEEDLFQEDQSAYPPVILLTKKQKFVSRSLVAALLALVIVTGSFLFYQIYSHQRSQSDQISRSQSLMQSGQQVADIFKAALPFKYSADKMASQINILILGMAGANYPGSQLTDSIVIIHLRPKERGLTAVSLPRDLLVKVPGRLGSNKINALYYSVGIEPLKQKIEEITGLSIDYYLAVDLSTVEEIIDLIDGLNVYVPKNIYDPYFPNAYGGYKAFSIKAGWRYMDGSVALKYMRTRYTSAGGDFDRMARQQQMLRAIKQKVFSLNPLWDFVTYLNIFNSLQSKITTDLSLSEIKNFWYLAQDLDINKIKTGTIDKENTDLVIGSSVMFGEQKASVILPKAGYKNYSAIREYIANLIER